MKTAVRFLVNISSVLNGIAMWGAVAAVAVMVFAALWQVVARYIFASPPIWTEELARYAMVWGGMLGASCAFHSNADPTLFPEAVTATGRRGLVSAIIRAAGVAVFALPVLWYSFIGPNGGFARGFIARSLARDAEMLSVSMVWFASAIPVAFLLVCIHALAAIGSRIDFERGAA